MSNIQDITAQQPCHRHTALQRVATALTREAIADIQYPGGKRRESILLTLESGRNVIATRRSKIDRAAHEAAILRCLSEENCKVPRLLGTNHARILLQQALTGTRLSRELTDAPASGVPDLVSRSLTSLHQIHVSASRRGLEQSTGKVLGGTRQWTSELLDRPAVLGRHLGIPAPVPHKAPVQQLLRVRKPRFIKWDARPGNAVVGSDNQIYWFDWEHAGNRNRLDDMIWLLGDEFVPLTDEQEDDILRSFLPRFADTMSLDEAQDYFHTLGCLHSVIRLTLIIKNMKGKWWDKDFCIEQDKIGITLDCAQRICRRGSRFAERSTGLHGLAGWFDDIRQHVEAL